MTDGTFEAINKRLFQKTKTNELFERDPAYGNSPSRREEEEKSEPILNES